MDLRVEGIATRLQALAKYLDRRRDAVLAEHGLQWWEFKTLHMLRRGGAPYQATPGQLATQLGLSPAAMTNRIARRSTPRSLSPNLAPPDDTISARR